MGSNRVRSIWMAEKALSKLRDLPRVSINNLQRRPEDYSVPNVRMYQDFSG